MENKPAINLVDQPNVCRCCLSAAGTWDLTKEYETQGNIKEVFSVLLQECFGVFLAHLEDNASSQFACNHCVEQLRDANNFRKQVLTAELTFIEYIDKKKVEQTVSIADVKIEPDYELNELGTVEANCESYLSDNEPKQTLKCTKNGKNSKKGMKLEPVDVLYLPEHESLETVTCKTANKCKKNEKPKMSKSRESLERNKKMSQNRILYKCIRENTALVLKNSTVVPFRNLKGTDGKYSCQYCEICYLQISDLRSHVEDIHAKITEAEIISYLKTPIFQLSKAEISQIRCKICADDFESLESLTDHLVTAHGKSYHRLDFKPPHGILGFIIDSENAKCCICSKKFSFFHALMAHMSEHGSENFKCDKCGKKFFTQIRLSTHYSRAHEEQAQTFQCKFCDETFPRISTRQSHMKTKHQYGWLKCGECGDSFLDHQQRSRHMVKAHNYKTPEFNCSLCPKVFSSASNLSAHIRTHGDNKKFNCEVCGKKLTSKHSLTIHLRVHTGERPYACQFCEKRFKSFSILDMHERGHLNDKRYVCELCEAAFVQINSLKRHYRAHHPNSGIDLTKLRARKVD